MHNAIIHLYRTLSIFILSMDIFLYTVIPRWALESTHARRQKPERSKEQQDLMMQK